jgi:hypothetical protein
MERMLRPEPVVVPDSALVPSANQLRPPPNQFTHQVRKRQPFYYGAKPSKQPDGEFEVGTKVVLMVHDKGKMCRVVDGQGLYVLTAFEGLKKLRA